MQNYKNRLRDLRIDADLTQKEISEKFYLQLTQYRRYENGNSDLPLEWAKKFARFYNVSIDYIAGIIDIPKPLYITSGLKAEEQKIITAYKSKKEMQKAVKTLLEIK